ncbi:uncharacterized protein MYCFIDRAFT_214933 [Pseudocercospora fijiensis CIRAD86]|uniref:SPX domain-containing protein n=1 Tax=Pseudocercospora fijiensis (strain CIRAD86) TaxID=383855 RepID=M3B6U0_PSEFD|nr:uncharacterized protein MYCFIDRAFT_214933 [Pseudocercospora fijiensis CIRAD86]EME85053.1 hypothetical protein MYCFIDRAFT_214933 [Pseudocercospora fijiensis CIRAD86]
MKYGETLRQRSIPAWSHHNIDYDDIKHFIKENTTPGKGKSVSVPGKGDDKLEHFEHALFHILADQHHRIDLFARSKSGEIQRRLDHAKKQLRSLAARRTLNADSRIPVSRLERYGRLENDVIKAGDEIKSLARFTATQRTAFRKLIKKYKKWTGSAELEDRFRDEVLDDPKSFTKLDLGPLLDDYSATRQSIRDLYESQMQQSAGGRSSEAQVPEASTSAIKQLQETVESGSKVTFDANIATVPLGDAGQFASYFVHPENVVELQMLLLQYARFYSSRSRQSSVATPVTSQPHTPNTGRIDFADYHMLAADNLQRFAQEQSALTVDDREHAPGSYPQRAKACVRWNHTEDALACLRCRNGRTKSAYIKKKHVRDFFDKNADFSQTRGVALADSSERVEELRKELLKDDILPLFHFSSCRSRLVGLDESADGLVLATLDTGITIETAGSEGSKPTETTFPFALLLVRQEGIPKSELLAALDNSHLVERVRGFSLEYHAIWQTHKPSNIPAPFWLPMLSQDIRKLPPPAMKRASTAGDVRASGSHSADSNESIRAGTDSSTAVDTSIESPLQLESAPLKSLRKKKRRIYPEAESPKQKYWSEYDNPEDEDQNGFYIYVDPNETNAFDRFFDRIGNFFTRQKKPEEEALLYDAASPKEDEESSDEEPDGQVTRLSKPTTSFGTFARPASNRTSGSRREETPAFFLPQFSSICLAASLSLLFVAYILHQTGRHKYLQEVHIGVFFSILCSLGFVLLGFMNVIRSGSRRGKPISYAAWAISIFVLIVDAVGSGGLVAWMLG